MGCPSIGLPPNGLLQKRYCLVILRGFWLSLYAGWRTRLLRAIGSNVAVRTDDIGRLGRCLFQQLCNWPRLGKIQLVGSGRPAFFVERFSMIQFLFSPLQVGRCALPRKLPIKKWGEIIYMLKIKSGSVKSTSTNHGGPRRRRLYEKCRASG